MVVQNQERYIRTSPRRIADEELQHYVDELVCTIADNLCDEIRVYVLHLPGFNAFMMPNGAMFIQSGLLLRVESESELASVIGHEIAHFSEAHSIKNVRRWRKTANTFAVLGAIVGAAGTVAVSSAGTYESASKSLDISNTAVGMLQAAQVFATFQLVAYGRSDEKQADSIGLTSLHKAGFDPSASARVWENYLLEHEAAKKEGGFSILATHPSPRSRFEELRNLAGTLSYENIYTETDPLLLLVNKFRSEWLESEAQALHPLQFEALISRQQLFSKLGPGYLSNLQAFAWVKYGGKQFLSRKKKQEALEKARAHYRSGDASESGLPTEAIRDWGRISQQLGFHDEAKLAFQKYLELTPDAWDAKFLRKELENY